MAGGFNQDLRVIESADGWRVDHVVSGCTIATFKTENAARKFYMEICDLDWNFANPLRTPQLTWLGVRDAMARRGVKLTPDWTLEPLNAC
jgi:hypothetical protein